MALLTIEYAAKALRKSTSMTVIVPETAERQPPFPVLYLLHGLSHDHGAWLRNTNVYRYASEHSLIVVMPDGQRNFYCNDPRPDGLAFEDHIIHDVIPFIDRTFPTLAQRSARAIAGMSMGGYGAMMLALRHPGLFSTVCPLAPAIFFAHDLKREGPAGVQGFAAALPPGKYDCFKLARCFDPTRHQLAIRIGCGQDDSLLDVNRQFHDQLEALGVAHEFVVTPGGHNSLYSDANLPAVLDYVMAQVASASGDRQPSIV
jgi:putative tributyrin esterase